MQPPSRAEGERRRKPGGELLGTRQAQEVGSVDVEDVERDRAAGDARGLRDQLFRKQRRRNLVKHAHDVEHRNDHPAQGSRGPQAAPPEAVLVADVGEDRDVSVRVRAAAQRQHLDRQPGQAVVRVAMAAHSACRLAGGERRADRVHSGRRGGPVLVRDQVRSEPLSHGRRHPTGDARERPIGELVKDLSEQTSTLVRKEIELARAELRQKGTLAGKGAGMLGAAAVGGLLALGALTAALIAVLAAAMATWIAALIVMVLRAVVAAILAKAGQKSLQQATPPVPQTVETVKEDIQWAKNPTGSAPR
jgi:hypothetical protein